MGTRRLQVYWLPGGSMLAVVAAAVLLDLPERGALVRSPEYGFQIGRYDTTSFVAASLLVLALAWVAQAVTDGPRRPSPVSHFAYYAAFGVLYADLVFLGGAHGETAETAGWSLWAFAGLVPAAWAGRHVVSRLEDARAREEGPWDTGAVRRPPLRLGAGEKAIWVGRREAPGYRFQLWLSPPLHALALGLLFWTRGGLGIDDLPIGAFLLGSFLYHLLVASAVEVTISESAVRVATGPLRVPLWRIPLEEVAEARVEDVRPRAYGGYGYLAKGGRRGLVVRAGPGLLLRRKRGRDVLVTVEGAEEGAALLNALIERRARAEAGAGAP